MDLGSQSQLKCAGASNSLWAGPTHALGAFPRHRWQDAA